MKKTVRLFALLLAMLMLCTTFLFGCSGDTQTATVPTVTVGEPQGGSGGDENAIYDAEIHDLQGYEFLFYVRDNNTKHLDYNEIWNDGTSTDKVDQAVFRRNSLLERDYNCKITEERMSDPFAQAADSLISGDYVCDYIAAHAYGAATFAKRSLLVDMASLESMNLEKNWYDQEGIRGMNMKGKTFFLTGDGMTLDNRLFTMVFYNREIVELVEDDINLYQEVRDGTWTVDRMLELIEKTSVDLDGDDAVKTFGTDRVGYVAGNTWGNWLHVAATGTYLCEFDELTGDPEIPLAPKRELLDVWEALRPIITTPYRCLHDDGLPVGAGKAFRSGYVTFFACNLGSITNWGDQQYTLGVLPYPKLNAEQEFYWNSGHWNAGGLMIPINGDKHPAPVFEAAGFESADEMRGYFLEAFFYYSRDTLTPAFFEQVINKQIAMDVETSEMIELASQHVVYDPVILYNFGGMRTLFAECGGRSNEFGTDIYYDNFQSEYERRVSAARTAIADYLTFLEIGAM